MYVLCSAQNKDAVRLTLEQIDVVKRMCNSYEELELVTTSQGDTLSCNRIFLLGFLEVYAKERKLEASKQYPGLKSNFSFSTELQYLTVHSHGPLQP